MSQKDSDAVNHDGIREQIERADHDEDFDYNLSNTVKMVLKAYKKLWHPVPFEGIQNSVDGWRHNTHTGIIDNRPLHIKFHVDTDEQTLTWEDNAGGMSSQKLNKSFLALDNPGEEKEDGNSGGGYGRGSVAMLALGDYFYVETRHEGSHVAATGEVLEGEEVSQSEVSSEGVVGELDVQGTHVTLHDVPEQVLEGLADEDAVRQAVVEKFPGILGCEDVEIDFRVDGKRVEFPALDLASLREQAESWTVKELDEVHAKGENRRVRNLHVVDARTIDREIPWKGVALLKADKYSDEPWMAVDIYNPNGVRALSDEEMFAWADVSEYCPECEDAGHEGFVHVDKADMGIKDELRELNRRHFRPDADEQREQIEEEAKQELNHLFGEHADGLGLGGSASETDGASGSGYTGPDRVRVRHPGDDVSAGADVDVKIDVDAKNANTDADKVELYHVTVRDSQTGETVETLDGETLSADAKQTVTRTVTIPSEGRYSVTAWLREAEGERIDKSHSTLATSEETTVLPTGCTDDFDFVEDVDVAIFQQAWEGRRHVVQRDDGEGLTVYVNENWPAFAKTFDWGTKKRNTEQKALLTRIGLEAIFEWMLENPAEVGKQRRTLKQMRDDMKRKLWEKYGDDGSVEVAF